MALFSFSAVQLLGTFTLVLAGYVFYQTKLHPLAKYPGPFLARLTRLWQIRMCFKGEHLVLLDLHRQYGPVVRYGPNLLVFNEPETVKICYGARAKYDKANFWRALEFPPGVPASLNCRSHTQHSKIKRQVASAFSLNNALQVEYIIDGHIAMFAKQIGRHFADTGKALDFAQWGHYVTSDILSDLGFGKAWGMVRAGKDLNDHISSLRKVGAALTWFSRLPELCVLLTTSFSRRLLEIVEIEKGGIGDLIRTSKKLVFERYSGEKPGRKDMLQIFIESRDINGNAMTKEEVHAEASLLLLAGGEPTTGQLVMFMKDLVNNPRPRNILLKELDEYFAAHPNVEVIPYSDSKDLKYLNACFKESLRMNPGVGTILPRVVPDGGEVFYDIWVPPGTEVATNPWVLSRDTQLYGDDVWDYRPERWIDSPEEKIKEMEAKSFAFGSGARACLGRNIATLALTKVIATLWRDYNFEPVKDPTKQFKAININFFHYKDLWFDVTPRGQSQRSALPLEGVVSEEKTENVECVAP